MRRGPTPLPSAKLYWCNSHQRRATHFCENHQQYECDPNLGGIMIPCSVVDLTNEVEIEDDGR